MSYQRAVQEHDVIRHELSRLTDMIGQASPLMSELLAILAALSAHLEQHLAFERDFVCVQLAGMGGAIGKAAGENYRLDIDGLGLLLQHFLNDWPNDCIQSDMSGFKEDAMMLITEIHRQFSAEEEGVYPLALKFGAIRLRDHM